MNRRIAVYIGSYWQHISQIHSCDNFCYCNLADRLSGRLIVRYFGKKRSYGNDPMAYGIISRFLWKSEFDSVITSQICVFWGVPHFSGCMCDHQKWLSCMQTMHVHHISASSHIIKYDHDIWSSRCIIMVYGCILSSNLNIIDYLPHFQEYLIFHIWHHVLSPSVA